MTFEDYLTRTVAPARISLGRRMLAENRGLLDKIAATYHVQPRFIVAFWGIESDFGRLTGGFSVPAALATLAWDGRRASLFREELFEALQIIQDGHVTAAGMTGSWAGAMGQAQFMPSSFRRYAVDGDGDGKRDIWTTRADVFASIANYLSQVGWHDDETWGRRVSLPERFDRALINPEVKKTLQEWDALGVRRADGLALPTRDLQGSLVEPTAGKGPVFMVYDNFRTTLRWNRSTFFALAIGHLADAVSSGDS
jgi:membrane-bound lytic murein transglycosylase B